MSNGPLPTTRRTSTPRADRRHPARLRRALWVGTIVPTLVAVPSAALAWHGGMWQGHHSASGTAITTTGQSTHSWAAGQAGSSRHQRPRTGATATGTSAPVVSSSASSSSASSSGASSSGASSSGSSSSGSWAPSGSSANDTTPETATHPSTPPPTVGIPLPQPGLSTGAAGSGASAGGGTGPMPALHVAGHQFVDDAGRAVRLTGYNLSGTEYSCIEGPQIFDTANPQALDPATLGALRSWRGANVVRMNLNEQCWLGLLGNPAATGAPYRAAVGEGVKNLTANGFAVVLDLHRNAPGTATPSEQEPMPDADHSVTFWGDVAKTFKDNRAVLFDLFNEPFPDTEAGGDAAWKCWRDGGCTRTSANSHQPYTTAGMNQLIASVRSAGARNVVLAGGLNYAEDMSGWLKYRPTDPTGNLAASTHTYSFNDCSTTACYDSQLAGVASTVPLFVGELGPDLTIKQGFDEHCPTSVIGNSGFSHSLLSWLEGRGISFSAWAFDNWNDCWSLIKDWQGTPTAPWGTTVKQFIAAAEDKRRP